MSHFQPKPLRLITRCSALALWQAHYAALYLKNHYPTEIIKRTSLADEHPEASMQELQGKGAFVRTLETALLNHEADMAVHSLKDLSVNLQKPLTLAMVLPRHRPEDVALIPRTHLKKLPKLPREISHSEHLAILGNLKWATSSPRRAALLTEAQPKTQIIPIRGNVDTRLRKVLTGTYGHGLILAAASLTRLAGSSLAFRELLKNFKILRLNPHLFVPSPGQGILALEGLNTHPHHTKWQSLSCGRTLSCALMERSIVRSLGGHCMLPLGVYAQITSSTDSHRHHMQVRVFLASPKRSARCFIEESWHPTPTPDTSTIETLTQKVLTDLKKQKAHLIFKDLGLPSPRKVT